MANIIKPKRSSTSSSAPTTSDLADGEIAVNTADQKIYMRSGGSIVTVGNAGSGIDNISEDTSPQLGGNLDLNSNNITGTGNITTTGDLTLTDTTDDSAAGPEFEFYRNSPSPADGDYLGQIKFQGENDADQKVLYAKITGKINDASDTTEDGLIEYAVRKAGTHTIVARLTGTALKLLNSTGLEVAGNITVTGNVDGRDVATDGTKLDGIEASADVTDTTNVVAALTAGTNVTIAANGTISSTDTNTTYSVGDGGLTQNNFTNADHSKLNGIEASATNTADPAITSDGSTPSLASGITAAEVRSLIGAGTSSSNNATHTGEVTGATALTVASNVIDADNLKVTGNGTTSQFLRSDGDGTFTWATPTDTNTTYSVGDGGLTQKNFTTTLKSKLDGIESNATADQTAAQILTAIKTVDGGGSGLDADTVDGIQASSFLRSNAFDTSSSGLYLQGGSYSAGTDTVTAPLVIDEGDHIYTKDGGYLRKLIGKTTGDTIEIGHGGTALIDQINLIPGSAGNSAVKVNGNTVWNAGNDGSGSGLDADLLDGYHLSTTRNAANTVPVRDANGYLQLGWINTTSGATTSTINKIYASNDSYVRYVTPATLISQLGLWTSGNDGSGSGLDADLLDGAQGSLYARLANPTFTGTPDAPTASTGTNTTQLATTAFVQQEINALKALLYAYDQS